MKQEAEEIFSIRIHFVPGGSTCVCSGFCDENEGLVLSYLVFIYFKGSCRNNNRLPTAL